MTIIRMALVAAAFALAVAAAAPAAPATRLTGTVGPGFTITLKKAGKKVTTLPARSYTFAISDRSGEHNFRLRGPGLNRPLTTAGFVGKKSVTIRLRKGKYTFYCNPHRFDMFGKFTVK